MLEFSTFLQREDVIVLEKSKVYPYRWIVLLSTIPVLAMTNVFWLTFAPITSIAEKFYDVSPLRIAFLSMSYMIVYIIMAVPASWLVDTKGFRMAMGFGAIATAVFGITRGIFADNFAIVTFAQLGAAVGQPFLTNSMTKVAARWFPINERATATGIASMAGCLGMIAAMVLTPVLTSSYGVERMLMLYGYTSIACALIFILLSREYPPTPPGNADELTNKLNRKDIIEIIKKKDFKNLTICFFVILGAFNAIMTWIEDILRPKGMSPDQSGLIGGMIVVFGLVGAVVLPALSDRLRKRQPLLVWCIFAAILGAVGLTFFSNYTILLISTCIMGFFILGMGPVGFQYGAEIAYPVPEGTSYGILMMSGQLSGILFIFLMDLFRSPASGTMTLSLIILTLLLLASFFIAARLKESEIIQSASSISEPDEITADKARQLVCDSGKRLLRSGYVSGTWGNISCRIDTDFMAITPSGREYESLTPEDMVIVNIHDLSYKGDMKPSGEMGLHAEIYRQRSEISAVMHTHSPNASTVAASRREVPPILDDMAQIIGPSLRVADYALPGTAKIVKATMKALSGRNAALLANHGAVCVGRDMDEAFVTCEIMEKSCRAFIESEFLGGSVPINGVEAWVMHQFYLKKYSKQKDMHLKK